MKKGILLLLLLIFSSLYAQDYEIGTIRDAEAKSALNRMQFRPNANTGNYDVKYHRL